MRWIPRFVTRFPTRFFGLPTAQFYSGKANQAAEKPSKASKTQENPRLSRTLFNWQNLLQKPTLRSRITSFFFVSFILFALLNGSSLLLFLNYQMRQYTQFVSYQYATQLARMLEAYYRDEESWSGINEWLQENFIDEQSTRERLAYSQNSRLREWQSPIRTPFYLSLSIPNNLAQEAQSTKGAPNSKLLSLCSTIFCPLPDATNAIIPDLVMDLWFYQFYTSALIPSSLASSYATDDPLLDIPDNSYTKTRRKLQQFFNKEGFSNWINEQERPELFTSEWLAADPKRPFGIPTKFPVIDPLLAPNYITIKKHQIFILLDSQKVIASNLNPNNLKTMLGKTWEPLQKYIKSYLTKNKHKPKLGNAQSRLPATLYQNSSLYFSLEPPSGEKQNIFPIKDRSGQVIAFLYAKSIISPMWKDLNSKINHIVIKVSVFLALIMVLIYLLFSHFHLRNLFIPLDSLSNIAEQVRKGHTQVRVKQIPKEVELALVSEQFNKMLDSLNYQTMLRDQQSRDVAHELRTPLTIISGELQLIQTRVHQPNEETIEGLINQVNQIQGIVHDLEILYKMPKVHKRDEEREEESETAYFESVSAVQLINDAFWAFQNQMKQKEIVFSLHPGSEQVAQQCLIHGDSRRLNQVFANCLVNAIRHTPPGGKIEIACHYLGKNPGLEPPLESLDEKKEYLIFSISDSGCGIPPEKRELIFERFFRIESNRSSRGSGLGLAICKNFIELHNGKIWVTSSQLGDQGAKFCFALPCYLITELA